MDFLKELFGEDALNYEQFTKLLKDKDIKLANLKEGNYVAKDKFDTAIKQKEEVETLLSDRDKQLKELQKLEPEKLQDRIKELEEMNKTEKAESEKRLHDYRVNSAIDLALTSEKAKNTKAARALLDLDFEKAELDDDGTVKGLSDLIKGVKETAPYLFEAVEEKGGLKGAGPDGSNPDPLPKEPKTYEDFLAIENANN